MITYFDHIIRIKMKKKINKIESVLELNVLEEINWIENNEK